MRSRTLSPAVVGWLAAVIWCSAVWNSSQADEPARPSTLLDLSGLTWVAGDLFLGVHDAKDDPQEKDRPRVSTVRLPKSELQGVIWDPVELEFPGGRSSDLESACSIPGGHGFLLCESGQEGKRRIFHAVYDEGRLSIESHIQWPIEIKNVEATEVCRVGDRLMFLYAERAESQPSTQLCWAPFSLDPLEIGAFQSVKYAGVDPVGKGSRPLVALDIDRDGLIYSVSAYDSGSDDGPYRSVVWQIGKITNDVRGAPVVVLGDAKRLATMDGLKVESIAVRKTGDGHKQVFVGTDDEHYGGILRLLP